MNKDSPVNRAVETVGRIMSVSDPLLTARITSMEQLKYCSPSTDEKNHPDKLAGHSEIVARKGHDPDASDEPKRNC